MEISHCESGENLLNLYKAPEPTDAGTSFALDWGCSWWDLLVISNGFIEHLLSAAVC